MKIRTLTLPLWLIPLVAGAADQPRLKTVEKVELDRFMGPW